MGGRRGRNVQREQFWRDVVSGWRRSGQTVRAYCAEVEVSEPSFYAWRRTLGERERQRSERRTGPTLVPVRVVPDAVLEVVLPTGLIVRVPGGADAQAVAKLVAALGSASC